MYITYTYTFFKNTILIEHTNTEKAYVYSDLDYIYYINFSIKKFQDKYSLVDNTVYISNYLLIWNV